jgi:glycine/D-amino acid oxidase-like deaminating enzyme
MRVVIAGAGVIGASIAYFLTRRGVKPIVVEPTGVAHAASGKSGGFLALDWCDGSPLQALARRSFALHANLASELGGDWGFRRMDTFGGFASARREIGGENPSPLPWLSSRVTINQRLGTGATTAQVHPGAFTRAMIRAAEARGAELRHGAVTDIFRDGGRVRDVEIDGEALSADAVIIAMGPWSIHASGWLPLPRIFGLKGHSLVFETGSAVPAEALFLEYQEANGAALTPEVFPRTDGTTYICAISSESAVPDNPADVTPDPGALERLEELATKLSPELRAAKILARQACYRPVTQDGLPLIGKVPGVAGAYIATGHSVWGILNAPATGEAMAELIVDGVAKTVDLSPFDPGRLPLARSAAADSYSITSS